MNILIVAAHPDDPEFFGGGTIARWVAEGNNVSYVIVTGGQKGSDRPDMMPQELGAMRQVEQRNAAAVLGVHELIFLNYVDGELANTLALQRDLAREIRRAKADIIATTDPLTLHYGARGVNHNDHRVMGAAVCDAVFPAANNRMYFPELLAEGFDVHAPREIWFAGSTAPNTWVDITDFITQKARAACQHLSQVKDPDPEKMVMRMRQGTFRMTADGTVRFVESFRRVTL
jgi:LmbE family N-acetylglucosaminyl deacetylase